MWTGNIMNYQDSNNNRNDSNMCFYPLFYFLRLEDMIQDDKSWSPVFDLHFQKMTLPMKSFAKFKYINQVDGLLSHIALRSVSPSLNLKDQLYV